VFDLDNTLHNATPHIFPQINTAMTQYLQSELGIDATAAGELRRHYWQRYGATLIGLMRHHGTDPRHFLWHTHQFPDLKRMLVREPRLRATLRRLPGRKFVFSNAPVHYSRAVLSALGISDLFECANHIRLARCIMVEDTLENLRTAKKLGMKTIWISRAARAPSYVDVRTASLMRLTRMLARLE